MTEYTFRSPDTATAMDRVQRELGDDAYILSIQNVEGMVEIKAIKEPIYVASGFRRNQPAKYKKTALPTAAVATGFVFEDDDETSPNETGLIGPLDAGDQTQDPAPVTWQFSESNETAATTANLLAEAGADTESLSPTPFDDVISDPQADAVTAVALFEATAMTADTEVSADTTNPEQIAQWNYNSYLEGVVPLVGSIADLEKADDSNAVFEGPIALAGFEVKRSDVGQDKDITDQASGAGEITSAQDDFAASGLTKDEKANHTGNVAVQPRDAMQSETELLQAFQSDTAIDGDVSHPRLGGGEILAPNAGGPFGALVPESMEKAEILASRGFTDSFIAALPLEVASQTSNELLEQAVRRLSKGLVPPLFSTDPLALSQLAIIGPPGSGKTTLAAKIACERFSRSSNASMLISLRAAGTLNDTKLRDLARMMNMPHTEIREAVPTMPKKHAPFILDFDNIGYKNTIARLSDLNDMSPDEPLRVALTLPATWGLNALMLLVDTYAHLNPILVMTQMDIGGVGIEEFCSLYDRGVQLSLLSGTNAVVNTIKASHEELLYQYLSELTEFEQ
jgi:flagellar biosynthesis GTPase FlhF